MNPALKQDILTCATIIDSHNYGTVLQAVATRDVFEHYGHPVFIDYCRPHWTTKGWIKSYMGNTNRNVPERLARLVANAPVRHKSSTLFRSFVERELELCSSAPYLAHGGGPDSNAVYCVGSDQTWNIECNYGIDPVYFLKNVPGNYKKIAFSASFGRPSLSAEEAALTKPLLSQFDAISVRESSSVAILEEMGLNGTALKDPVLLCRTGALARAFGGRSCRGGRLCACLHAQRQSRYVRICSRARRARGAARSRRDIQPSETRARGVGRRLSSQA